MKQERKDQNEKIKELTEQLHEGITNLFESERYRDYLQAMAKFHNYSFNNSLLIWAQRPDASAVAGYRAWQTKFQRTVNPGAKGIIIIEPAPWKRTIHEKVFDEDGNPVKDQEGNELTQEVERTYQGFKVGYVFAYEDTSGKPLPSIVSILDKEVDNFDSVMDALRKISPAPIRFDSVDGGANGYYNLGEEDFASIRGEMLEKYLEKFKQPETFIKIGNDILAIKLPEERQQTEGQTHKNHIQK